MNLGTFFQSEFDEHLKVAAEARDTLAASFVALTERCVAAVRNGGKIMFFGNGGSAADAQHLATEFTIRYIKDRPAIAAIALTTDSSALTAAGNDLGFDRLFARQIEALGKPEDVAIGISTSGTSPNVIEGLRAARRMGLVTAGLAGRGGGDMVGLADPLIVVPHQASNRIQEMHITIGHALCGAVEIELGLAEAR